MSVDRAEVARFGALAGRWWDASGPMRPLHAMNPLRVGWIDARIRARAGGAVRLLDIGCGAGLAAEALARCGHQVLGVDAAPELIAAAEAHAAGQHLPLTYRLATAEALAAEGARFQAVTALEVVEHVADPAAFLHSLAALLEPGGQIFMSTLNRTWRSFAMAKIGAEYVLRMLPPGTHEWRKFLPPAELAAMLRAAGLGLADIAGLGYDPLRGRWRTTHDTAVNYILEARSAPGPI